MPGKRTNQGPKGGDRRQVQVGVPRSLLRLTALLGPVTDNLNYNYGLCLRYRIFRRGLGPRFGKTKRPFFEQQQGFMRGGE